VSGPPLRRILLREARLMIGAVLVVAVAGASSHVRGRSYVAALTAFAVGAIVGVWSIVLAMMSRPWAG
jgi:hypothetical protein